MVISAPHSLYLLFLYLIAPSHFFDTKINNMGSLSSPPPSTYQIYATFCSRDQYSNSIITNWIECYDPSSNEWCRVSRIPGLLENHVLKGFSMVSLGGFIFVIGGRLCKKMRHGQDDVVVEDNLEVLRSVLRYSVSEDAWSTCAPMNVPRFDFACAVHGDKIYVAGGQSTLANGRGVSSTEVYDVATGEWRVMSDMSMLRYKCVGVTWQGKIHVVGGFAERVDKDRELRWNTMERSSAEVYDPEHAKWDLMVGMWQLDVPPNQIVAVEGKLFSSGDCLNAWKGHIESYDGKLWNVVDGSYLQSMSSPAALEDWPPGGQRIYLTMASIGTNLYFLAGYRMAGEIAKMKSFVHVFDTSENGRGWRKFEPTIEEGEKELCSHCCVVAQI